MYIPISKEFELQPLMITGLPLCAQAACIDGPHNPVNPHRQRLLVASHKSAKLEKKGATSKSKAKPTPAVPENLAPIQEGMPTSADTPQPAVTDVPAGPAEKTKAPRKKNPESLYLTTKKKSF